MNLLEQPINLENSNMISEEEEHQQQQLHRPKRSRGFPKPNGALMERNQQLLLEQDSVSDLLLMDGSSNVRLDLLIDEEEQAIEEVTKHLVKSNLRASMHINEELALKNQRLLDEDSDIDDHDHFTQGEPNYYNRKRPSQSFSQNSGLLLAEQVEHAAFIRPSLKHQRLPSSITQHTASLSPLDEENDSARSWGSSPKDIPRPKIRHMQSNEGLDEILSPPRRSNQRSRQQSLDHSEYDHIDDHIDDHDDKIIENIHNDEDDDFIRPVLLRNDQSSRHGILTSSSDADTWNDEEKKRDDDMYDLRRQTNHFSIIQQTEQPLNRLQQLKEEKRKLEVVMSMSKDDLDLIPSSPIPSDTTSIKHADESIPERPKLPRPDKLVWLKQEKQKQEDSFREVIASLKSPSDRRKSPENDLPLEPLVLEQTSQQIPEQRPELSRHKSDKKMPYHMMGLNDRPTPPPSRVIALKDDIGIPRAISRDSVESSHGSSSKSVERTISAELTRPPVDESTSSATRRKRFLNQQASKDQMGSRAFTDAPIQPEKYVKASSSDSNVITTKREPYEYSNKARSEVMMTRRKISLARDQMRRRADERKKSNHLASIGMDEMDGDDQSSNNNTDYTAVLKTPASRESSRTPSRVNSRVSSQGPSRAASMVSNYEARAQQDPHPEPFLLAEKLWNARRIRVSSQRLSEIDSHDEPGAYEVRSVDNSTHGDLHLEDEIEMSSSPPRSQRAPLVVNAVEVSESTVHAAQVIPHRKLNQIRNTGAVCIMFILITVMVIVGLLFGMTRTRDEITSDFCQIPPGELSVFDQCRCFGDIKELPSGFNLDTYNQMSHHFLYSIIEPDFFVSTPWRSCLVENQVVIWMSDEKNAPEGFFDEAGNASIEKVVQRFVVILLHAEMGGYNWKESSGWLTPTDVCEWHGIVCRQLSQVGEINLENNDLQGAIPHHLQHLNLMRELSLSGNPRIQGTIPPSLLRSRSLNTLDLKNCGITGTLPSFEEARQLDSFIVQNNSITGQIPTTFGTRLRQIVLSDNALSSTIPFEIGNLNATLVTLEIGNNKLSGTLSESLSSLTRLEILGLEKNRLTGTIPSGFVDLVDLQSLSLHNNQFTGTIPLFLEELTQLSFLSLSGNDIQGEVTEEFCATGFREIVLLDCKGLSAQSCSCCDCVGDFAVEPSS